jgi:hypothetical protein
LKSFGLLSLLTIIHLLHSILLLPKSPSKCGHLSSNPLSHHRRDQYRRNGHCTLLSRIQAVLTR